ncbi:MAG TPA: hypothetical protein VKD24_05890 [Candidatus Angelobacter sp.]|nr:hypothetical protein [Candidatus Angelobacter sp.]
MIWDLKLNHLKQVIATEAQERLSRSLKADPATLAEWALTCHRGSVAGALEDLLFSGLEAVHDDRYCAQVAATQPELVNYLKFLRQSGATLGLGLWFLLGLDGEKLRAACEAATLVLELRTQENQRCHEELVDLEKRLRPVAAETENLTLTEALRFLEHRTAETISQLEQDSELKKGKP